MDAQWYYGKSGQQHGPMSRADLERCVAAGQVAPSDLVWTPGMANWLPASQVSGLFGQTPLGAAPFAPLPSQSLPPTPGAASSYPQASFPQSSPSNPYSTPQAPSGYAPYPTPRGNSQQGMAIASLVVSLASLVVCPMFGIVGMVLGFIALSGMKQTGNDEGKGLAIAGIIIGGIFTLLTVLCMLAFFAIGLAGV